MCDSTITTTETKTENLKWVNVDLLHNVWLIHFIAPLYVVSGSMPPLHVGQFKYHIRSKIAPFWYTTYSKPYKINYLIKEGYVIFRATHDDGRKFNSAISRNAAAVAIFSKWRKLVGKQHVES